MQSKTEGKTVNDIFLIRKMVEIFTELLRTYWTGERNLLVSGSFGDFAVSCKNKQGVG